MCFRKSTVCPWIYLERAAPYQMLSGTLVQSRKAVQFPCLRIGSAFDARSKVVSELSCLGFNTREAVKAAAAL